MKTLTVTLRNCKHCAPLMVTVPTTLNGQFTKLSRLHFKTLRYYRRLSEIIPRAYQNTSRIIPIENKNDLPVVGKGAIVEKLKRSLLNQNQY